MKKLLLFILNLFFILNVLLLMICYTFKDIFVNEILIETLRSKITKVEYKEPNNLTLEDVITEEGVITDNELVNELLQSEEIQALVNQYMDQVIDTLLDDNQDVSNLDPIELEQSMRDFLKENKEVLSDKTGIEITNEMIDNTFEKIPKEDIKKSTIQTIMNTKKNLTPKEKMFLRIYKIIVSQGLKNILWILLAINIILRMIIEKSMIKWIKKASILSIISGVFTMIISLGVKKVISSFLNNISIHTTPMNRIGIALIGIGFLVMILYKVGSVLKGGKHEVSKVSFK